MAFDLGVFLTVVGVVMLTLANLSRVGPQGGAGDRGRPTAMDIVLPPAAGQES